MTMKAIPTTFDGVNFRSRLEARWAAMFTLLGWRWTYEPIDLAGYIPDFLLHLAAPVLVEVKPSATWEDLEVERAALDPRLGGWNGEVLLVGCGPLILADDARLGLGLLAEVMPDGSRCWDASPLFFCSDCGVSSFCHATQSWKSRACGHYSGNATSQSIPAQARFDAAWRKAGNEVQWRRA
jgi:hypothetical protein